MKTIEYLLIPTIVFYDERQVNAEDPDPTVFKLLFNRRRGCIVCDQEKSQEL